MLTLSATDPGGGLIGQVCYEIYADAGDGERGEQMAAACDQPAQARLTDTTAANAVTFTGLEAGAYVVATQVPPSFLDPADRWITIDDGEALELTVVVQRAIEPSPSPGPTVSPSPGARPSPSPAPSVAPSPSISPPPSSVISPSPSASPPPKPSIMPSPSASSPPSPSDPPDPGAAAHSSPPPSPSPDPHPGPSGLPVRELPQTGTGSIASLRWMAGVAALLAACLAAAFGCMLRPRGRERRRQRRR